MKTNHSFLITMEFILTHNIQTCPKDSNMKKNILSTITLTYLDSFIYTQTASIYQYDVWESGMCWEKRLYQPQ